MSRNIAGILNIDGTKVSKTAGLLEISDSVSVDDDGTITLPTGVAGILKVNTDAEYAEVFIKADGTVEILYQSTNVDDDAATDAVLCIYDGGSGAVIKNRLGSTKTVRYIFQYS